ncbi:MAG: hypothetical protein EB100_06990, partial [Crocinitomicaceae bacterium]|nr:hypothetical protein [Crocinitomicaceae bacterium]
MANGVELRAPFLDIDVVNAAMDFTENELKIMGKKGPISFLASKYLPENIANQNKHGFSFQFNSIKTYIKAPNWNLEEIGLSESLCTELWTNKTKNYNYSLASWGL